MKFLVTFRPNWWIIGAIFEEICIYVEENEGFGQPLIPFILLIGELQMGPYMVTYWCVSECCSLIGSHRLYVYREGVAANGVINRQANQDEEEPQEDYFSFLPVSSKFVHRSLCVVRTRNLPISKKCVSNISSSYRSSSCLSFH